MEETAGANSSHWPTFSGRRGFRGCLSTTPFLVREAQDCTGDGSLFPELSWGADAPVSDDSCRPSILPPRAVVPSSVWLVCLLGPPALDPGLSIAFHVHLLDLSTPR